MILIENSGRLRQDFDALDRWGVVRFREPLFDKALKMLYEEPVCQIESNGMFLSRPIFCGTVFDRTEDMLNTNGKVIHEVGRT